MPCPPSGGLFFARHPGKALFSRRNLAFIFFIFAIKYQKTLPYRSGDGSAS
jgi:hypothetical protein